MDPDTPRPRHILPVIVFSQFAGTSLWFAGNAVLPDLERQWGLGAETLGWMTSAVQLGFISGTLIFAVCMISDRYSPRKLFLVSSLAGAFVNSLLVIVPHGLVSLLLLRFCTGFFLAGIYPIGMKIASGWYEKGLGSALGFLVGALVLGTAFPHLLKGNLHSARWENVVLSVSCLSAIGGTLMFMFVPDGPYLSKGTVFNVQSLASILRRDELRSAAFGYFGHMWELYAFYAFLPVFLSAYVAEYHFDGPNLSLLTFCIIAAGSIGCAGGGLLSKTVGSSKVASVQLACSGICCCISAVMFRMPPAIFFPFLALWGMTVVGDSPQFSTLSARYAPRENIGSVLTIINCIGFSITIASIQLLSFLTPIITPRYLFLFLIPGPVLGLLAMKRIWTS